MKGLDYVDCVMSSVKERSGMGKTHLFPGRGSKGAAGFFPAGSTGQVAKSVWWATLAGRVAALGSPCFPN